ncbi:MAG: HAD family phosphatase [Pirellulales bacterium]|nr:HAD family phosphatase [Pirellulales bacterium]
MSERQQMNIAIGANKAVIFDIDGVLIDSYRGHLQSWQQVAHRHGHEMTEEDFARTFGRTSREIIRSLWSGAAMSDADVESFDCEKEAAFREIVIADYPWMDGALDLISSLSDSGYRLAVGSSGPRENVELLLSQLNEPKWITAAVSGSDVLQGKPHPEVFQKAAEKLDIAPSACAVIEDAAAGIAASNAAGMLSVGLVSTGHRREEFAKAAQVVTHLSELSPEIIAAWINEHSG